MPLPQDDFEKRPTLRVIAREVGVTHATVSMALRNHPSISAKTRRRVQRIAEKLGYRPDPEVAKLMHHLRLKHKPRFKSTIAALPSIPEQLAPPYAAALRRGAQRAAEALGYGFSLFQIEGSDKRNTSLQRMLRSRGIEGVLILPMKGPVKLTDLLDWSCFSVVVATYGVLAPQFHRVIPDQFDNTRLICNQLASNGHRRIGLIAAARTDASVGQRFSAAVVWQNVLGGTEYVTPFIYGDNYLRGLRTWFTRQRPDAIILDGTEKEAREIAKEVGLPL